MPIRFRCQDCRSRVKVPEGSQGKQVKCPRCGRIQSVPNNHQAEAAGSPGAPGSPAGDLTVHTLVGSMYKSPKRKESLVSTAGDRFDANDESGGGVPGGLDIPTDLGNDQDDNDNGNGNGYPGHGQGQMSRKKRRRMEARARAAEEARLAEETNVTESRKLVADLFATSTDNDSSHLNDESDIDMPLETHIVTKTVPSPKAIAMSGESTATQAPPDCDPTEPTSQPMTAPKTQAQEADSEQDRIPLEEPPATDSEQQPHARWTLDLTAEAYPFLKMVPWVLRVAALLLIGPAFKAMLVASDQGFSAVVCMLVLFAGLTMVAVTWTVGEIATAVRDIALRKAAG